MSRQSYSRANPDDLGPTYWALLISIVIALTLMFSQREDARLRQAVQAETDGMVSPLITLVTQPIRGVENFFASMSDRQRAFEENVALRAELQQLREERTELVLMQEKIARYEAILGARPDTNRPLKKLATRAVSDINGPFVRALLVNSGRKDGVQKGQAVMSTEGMVGHIILAGETASRVLRLDDLNSRIPVKSERSDAVAILAGDNTNNPKLMFIEIGKDWQVGDKVMTSGDEGQLPRGLPIGEVIEGPNGELRVDVVGLQKPLDWIWVALFEPMSAPEDMPATEDSQSEDIVSTDVEALQ